MIFEDFAGTNLLFSHILPLLGLFLGLSLIYLSNSKFPMGNVRARLIFLFSFCCVGFLVSALGYLANYHSTKFVLSRLTFFWFSSLPLVFSLVIVDLVRSSGKLEWVLAFLAVFLLITPFLFPTFLIYIMLFLFLPSWLISLYRAYLLFRSGITSAEQSRSFRLMLIQIIAGLGIFMDFLTVPSLQKQPILYALATSWLMVETYDEFASKHNYEFVVERAANYLTPAFLTLLSLYLFRIETTLLDNFRDPLFTYEVRFFLVLLTALIGAIIYFPILFLIRKVLNLISVHFVDDFTRGLNRIDSKANLEEMCSLLKEHLPHVRFFVLFRRPFWKLYDVVGFENAVEFDESDKFFPPDTLFKNFADVGYSLWRPDNIESFAVCSPLFEKIAGMIEKTDFLFVPVLAGDNDCMPRAIAMFFSTEKRKFTQVEIRRLYLFSSRITASTLSEWSRRFAGEIETPYELHHARNRKEFASHLEHFLKKLMPIEKMYLAGIDDDGNVTWEPTDSVVSLFHVVQMEDGNWKLENRDIEEPPSHPFLIVWAGPRDALILSYDRKNFYMDPFAKDLLGRFCKNLGIILEKLTLAEELASQLRAVESLSGQIQDEKLKVAEELHDTIAQEMYASRLLIQLLEKRLRESAPKSIEEFDMLKSAINEGLAQTRSLIEKLKTESRRDESEIVTDLVTFARRIEAETGIAIKMENLDILRSFPSDDARNIDLIIREGINNARKHSKAKNLLIRLKRKGNFISLIIADDGVGFDLGTAIRENAFGISGIRSKCERLGGSLKIRSSPGGGFIINASIALKT